VVGRDVVRATAPISAPAVSLRNITNYSVNNECRAAFRTALKFARVVELDATRKARPIYLKKIFRKYDFTSNLSR
jgi:hypothetical protein